MGFTTGCVVALPRGGWKAVTVRLDLYTRLRSLAEARGVTMDEVIRGLVEGPTPSPWPSWAQCVVERVEVRARCLSG